MLDQKCLPFELHDRKEFCPQWCDSRLPFEVIHWRLTFWIRSMLSGISSSSLTKLKQDSTKLKVSFIDRACPTNRSWQYLMASNLPTEAVVMPDSIRSTTTAMHESKESIALPVYNAQVHAVDWDFELLVTHLPTLKLKVVRNANRRPRECNRWVREQSWA